MQDANNNVASRQANVKDSSGNETGPASGAAGGKDEESLSQDAQQYPVKPAPTLEHNEKGGSLQHEHGAKDDEAHDSMVPIKAKRVSNRKGFRKPRDMPRRPLSAYNLFFREQREIIMRERNDAKAKSGSETTDVNSGLFAQLGKTISRRWKDVPKDDLVRFEAQAKIEMKKYRAAMDEYNTRQKEKESMQTMPSQSQSASATASASLTPVLPKPSVDMTEMRKKREISIQPSNLKPSSSQSPGTRNNVRVAGAEMPKFSPRAQLKRDLHLPLHIAQAQNVAKTSTGNESKPSAVKVKQNDQTLGKGELTLTNSYPLPLLLQNNVNSTNISYNPYRAQSVDSALLTYLQRADTAASMPALGNAAAARNDLDMLYALESQRQAALSAPFSLQQYSAANNATNNELKLQIQLELQLLEQQKQASRNMFGTSGMGLDGLDRFTVQESIRQSLQSDNARMLAAMQLRQQLVPNARPLSDLQHEQNSMLPPMSLPHSNASALQPTSYDLQFMSQLQRQTNASQADRTSHLAAAQVHFASIMSQNQHNALHQSEQLSSVQSGFSSQFRDLLNNNVHRNMSLYSEPSTTYMNDKERTKLDNTKPLNSELHDAQLKAAQQQSDQLLSQHTRRLVQADLQRLSSDRTNLQQHQSNMRSTAVKRDSKPSGTGTPKA